MTRKEAILEAKELANKNINRMNSKEIKDTHKRLNELFKTYDLNWNEV
ncbi:hypothetical protein [uncultured Enterococcus sp.]|nr:hypothetical protein [uncultured Enterococcus sp.]